MPLEQPTASALAFSAAERKQLLRDPLQWLQTVGREPTVDLPGLLQQLACRRAEREQVGDRSRQLSRAIGEAKKAGTPTEELLLQKRELSALEREIAGQVALIEQQVIDCCSPPFCEEEAESSAAIVSPPDVMSASAPIELSWLSPADSNDWDTFVRTMDGASVYHLSGWAALIADAFGHECHYLLARSEGRVVGVLPLVRLNSRLFGNFLVSVPFFNYGGVLADADHVREALIERSISRAQELGCSHIELRDCQPLEGRPVRTDKVAMWLSLPDSAEALWQQIGSKVRAQIKKAQSYGLEFRVGGVELLDDFYRVFAINMRDLGTPVYSRRFFELILQRGLGDPVLVVGYDSRGKAVSTAFLLRFGSRMEVPWASTLREANALNANMALYWAILEHACAQRCDTFDFGRSTQDAPTYRFKKQWGAQPVQLYWHYWLADGGELPKMNPDNPKYRAAIAVWQRLPVWLTKLMGPPVVKNLP